MKQGTVLTRAVMLLLFAAGALISRWPPGRAFTRASTPWPPTPTRWTTPWRPPGPGAAGGGHSSGQAAAIVDVIPDQGEKVNAGGTVAHLYRDEAALERKRELGPWSWSGNSSSTPLQRGGHGLGQRPAGPEHRGRDGRAQDLRRLWGSHRPGGPGPLPSRAWSSGGSRRRRGGHPGQGGGRSTPSTRHFRPRRDRTPPPSGWTSPAAFPPWRTGMRPCSRRICSPPSPSPDLTALLARKPEAPEGAVGKLITSSTWSHRRPARKDGGAVGGRAPVKVRFSGIGPAR